MKIVKIICIVILVVVLGFVSYIGYEYITNKRDIIGINKILEKRPEDRGTAPYNKRINKKCTTCRNTLFK